jgi:hypothetical protein
MGGVSGTRKGDDVETRRLKTCTLLPLRLTPQEPIRGVIAAVGSKGGQGGRR